MTRTATVLRQHDCRAHDDAAAARGTAPGATGPRPRIFERCQHGDPPMRVVAGEAGTGVYAYPLRYAPALRPYYARAGERVYRLLAPPDAIVVDLTTRDATARLVASATATFRQMAERDPTYRVPAVTAQSVHRFGRVVERDVALHHPAADAYIVRHVGPGLPTGKQVVILRPERFTVSDVTDVLAGPRPEGSSDASSGAASDAES